MRLAAVAGRCRCCRGGGCDVVVSVSMANVVATAGAAVAVVGGGGVGVDAAVAVVGGAVVDGGAGAGAGAGDVCGDNGVDANACDDACVCYVAGQEGSYIGITQ